MRRYLDLQTIMQMLLGAPNVLEGTDPILVCIDCEGFESAQHMVTEVGVAILDTRNLATLGSATSSDAIISAMECANYRSVEYSNLANRRFVKGCPYLFDFGSSTWIELADAPDLLTRIFHNPSELKDAVNFEIGMPSQQRNIVIVGHSLGNDETYLRRLGFTLRNAVNIIGLADTQRLVGINKIGLTKVLAEIGIDAVNLHNAGNDAAFTLKALVKMAILEGRNSASVARKLCQIRHKPAEIHNLAAKAQYVWGGSAEPVDERKARSSNSRHARYQNTGSV